MSRIAFEEIARTADLFLNVSGACMIPDMLAARCVKVFIDTDPGYNQIMLSEQFSWSENVERWCASVAAHDRHFTYAENIHGTDCIIPKAGFGWKTTRIPIVLDLWDEIAQSRSPMGAPWTTVMTWNAFKGKLVYQGVEYKSKGSEFEKIIELPRRLKLPFEIAVGGVDAPLERLARHGWSVLQWPRGDAHARAVSRFHRRLARGTFDRQARLRRHAQRLVQLPLGVLSSGRKTSSSARHWLQQRDSCRRWTTPFQQPRRGRRSRCAKSRRIMTAMPGRACRGCRVVRLPAKCSAG